MEGIKTIDLIKLDAAGNELAVVQGGMDTFRNNSIPHLIVKFYNPSIVSERFGVKSQELRRVLIDLGYQLLEPTKEGFEAFTRQVTEYGVAILATHEPWRFSVKK